MPDGAAAGLSDYCGDESGWHRARVLHGGGLSAADAVDAGGAGAGGRWLRCGVSLPVSSGAWAGRVSARARGPEAGDGDAAARGAGVRGVAGGVGDGGRPVHGYGGGERGRAASGVSDRGNARSGDVPRSIRGDYLAGRGGALVDRAGVADVDRVRRFIVRMGPDSSDCVQGWAAAGAVVAELRAREAGDCA